MRTIKIGKLINQTGGFKAFIPYPFPPKGGFIFEPETLKKNDEATRLLGMLDGLTRLLPDSEFFLLMYLRKDAAASSQIEGTLATMIDSIEAEVKMRARIPQDVDDILHYIKALKYGIDRLKIDDFPISLRFIKELHRVLMEKARSTHFSAPGEFRKSQNWIGGSRPDNAIFVPPPVDEMNRSLRDLEFYMHSEDLTPIVIKAGIIHAQFETIHPFLDGNGRTGRMLITFYLWKEGFLNTPVLFLSSYFKKHQKLYYDRLLGYHYGEFEKWIDFFLDGVIEITHEAAYTVEKITTLREEDSRKIQSLGKRAAESGMLVLIKLFAQPIINNNIIQKWTGFSRAGAQKVIERFINQGILIPRDKDKKYDQSYEYKKYIKIFY